MPRQPSISTIADWRRTHVAFVLGLAALPILIAIDAATPPHPDHLRAHATWLLLALATTSLPTWVLFAAIVRDDAPIPHWWGRRPIVGVFLLGFIASIVPLYIAAMNTWAQGNGEPIPSVQPLAVAAAVVLAIASARVVLNRVGERRVRLSVDHCLACGHERHGDEGALRVCSECGVSGVD